MNLDYTNYFEIKADKRYLEKTVTIHDTGRIKISKAIAQNLEQAQVAIYVSNDYRTLVLNQSGCELKVKKDGSIQAKQAIEQFKSRKVAFPLIYEMDWDETENRWVGQLRLLNSTARKRRTKSAPLEELV